MTFTATGTVGAATQIAINVGNNQTATVGTAVPIAPSVLVRDVHQNPVPGVPVTFAIASGGGIVTGASATTNASGIATVGSWTLGTVAGVNTLTASIAGLSGSPVTFTAVGTPVTVPGVPTVGTQAGGEIGPGSTVKITQTLANSTATPTASTY
ncbi:MAG: hypothetical protein EBU88_10455, partial [Acidobacteria bacterium]|nr:hypothetical protein [Acidobacteriota bacterium]